MIPNPDPMAHPTHPIETDDVAVVALMAILAGQPGLAREPLTTLSIPELRRVAQACTALTSAAAQLVVSKAIDEKRASR